MNILSIDIGKKRIGLAINLTDFLAKEYDTIAYDGDSIKKILHIIKKENIQKIVVGLPINMDGSEGEMAKFVRDFSEKLEKLSDLPLDLEDERLTSSEAERQLRESGANIDEIKKRVDAYSAKLILEQYIG